MRSSVVVICDANGGLTHHQQIPTKSCNKLIVTLILVRLTVIKFFFCMSLWKYNLKMKMKHVTHTDKILLNQYDSEAFVVVPDYVGIRRFAFH